MALGFTSEGFVSLAELPADLTSPSGISSIYSASIFFSPTSAADNAPVWEERLLEGVTINQQAVDTLGLGGVVALAYSEIVMDNSRSWAEQIATFDLAAGRDCFFYQIEAANPSLISLGLAEAALVAKFTGLVRNVVPLEDERVRLSVSDITENMNVPAQSLFYTGLGGLTGEAPLKDKPLPICYGRVFNIAPVFLGNVDLGDGAKPTYQAHYRAIQQVEAVRIRGVLQSIVTGVPGVGQYKSWLTNGCFQLGSTPDGAVTADVKGDSAGPLGYVNTTSAIIRMILTSLGMQYVEAKLDGDSFGFFELDLPGEIGLFQGAEPISVAELVQRIASGMGIIVSGGRNGKIRLVDPLIDTADQFELNIEDILSIKPLELPTSLSPAPRVVETFWQPNWAPLSEIAGSVAAADREKLTNKQSIVRASSAVVQGRNAKDRTLKFGGLYWLQADALARAQAWLTWIERGLSMFEITTDRYLNQLELGYIGKVTFPRYGLELGLRGVVVAWSESLSEGRVTFTVIGKKQ